MTSVNSAKWNIYAVALQDLTFFIFSYLKTNFNYQRAITRNINNPTTHAQHKELQNKKKSLSNDRFIQYLKEISKADND